MEAPTDLSWRPLGACHDLDPAIFFPGRGEPIAAAVAVCSACPVKDQCLEWALHHENSGIWGGASEQERRRMRKKRRIPVKTPHTLVIDPAYNDATLRQRRSRAKAP